MIRVVQNNDVLLDVPGDHPGEYNNDDFNFAMQSSNWDKIHHYDNYIEELHHSFQRDDAQEDNMQGWHDPPCQTPDGGHILSPGNAIQNVRHEHAPIEVTVTISSWEVSNKSQK